METIKTYFSPEFWLIGVVYQFSWRQEKHADQTIIALNFGVNNSFKSICGAFHIWEISYTKIATEF